MSQVSVSSHCIFTLGFNISSLKCISDDLLLYVSDVADAFSGHLVVGFSSSSVTSGVFVDGCNSSYSLASFASLNSLQSRNCLRISELIDALSFLIAKLKKTKTMSTINSE